MKYYKILQKNSLFSKLLGNFRKFNEGFYNSALSLYEFLRKLLPILSIHNKKCPEISQIKPRWKFICRDFALPVRFISLKTIPSNIFDIQELTSAVSSLLAGVGMELEVSSGWSLISESRGHDLMYFHSSSGKCALGLKCFIVEMQKTTACVLMAFTFLNLTGLRMDYG